MKSSAFHLTFHLSGIKLMDMKLFTHKRERGRVIQNLRVVVDYLACPAAIHVSRSTRGDAITFQWLDQGDTDGVMHYVDSDAMRDAFFLVKTPDEAEAFLKASGPFRSFALGVDWSMFQKWQEYFKQQRRLGAAGRGWGTPPEQLHERVLDRIIRVPLFEPLQVVEQPILAARADSVVECIAAVNYLERWSQTVVMSCRQCSDPFAPKTKASVFCSHSCAHSYWRAHGGIGERKRGANAKAAK